MSQVNQWSLVCATNVGNVDVRGAVRVKPVAPRVFASVVQLEDGLLAVAGPKGANLVVGDRFVVGDEVFVVLAVLVVVVDSEVVDPVGAVVGVGTPAVTTAGQSVVAPVRQRAVVDARPGPAPRVAPSFVAAGVVSRDEVVDDEVSNNAACAGNETVVSPVGVLG